jgi:hypothetical protein
MMGRLKSDQGQLFYEFRLGDAVPEDHLVRKIDAALDLSWLRSELAPHYSSMGRPSIDPELMIRMLVVGYVLAIRSERLICREVQVNLAYRWFCKLGNLMPAGERGEIVVRRSLVMDGYYKNAEATAEASAHGWHHTGDIGYLDADNFLYIVDRAKDMMAASTSIPSKLRMPCRPTKPFRIVPSSVCQTTSGANALSLWCSREQDAQSMSPRSRYRLS